MLKPFSRFVVIKPKEREEKKTASGLILSGGTNDNFARLGIVISCGPDCKYVQEGDIVSYSQYANYEMVEFGKDAKYIIMSEEIIYGTVTDTNTGAAGSGAVPGVTDATSGES